MIDIKYHSDIEISMMDTRTSNIRLADAHWNSLFEFITTETNCFIFEGKHINYFEGLEELIENVSSDVIYKFTNGDILLTVKQSPLLINRTLISKLWEQYEQATLYFLKDSPDRNSLTSIFIKKKAEEIHKELGAMYMLHSGIEPNVLWLKCYGLKIFQ